MAKKNAIKRAKAKNKPSKPTKPSKALPRGGGKDAAKGGDVVNDSEREKNYAMGGDTLSCSKAGESLLTSRASLASRITSSERRKLLAELSREIGEDQKRAFAKRKFPEKYSLGADEVEKLSALQGFEKTVHLRDEELVRMRIHLYRALKSPTLPDDAATIGEMLHRAPTAWHILTVVKAAVGVLLHNSQRHPKLEASSLRCLGEIARMFKRDAKLNARRSRSMREALLHPSFLKALNQSHPKRTRGGMGGNDSIIVLQHWTQMVICDFDRCYNRDRDPLRYSDTDTYIRKFMAFAKDEFDVDRLEWAETQTELKARTNTTGTKPKQSFSLFKDEIEKNARRILAGWQDDFAPIRVWVDEPPEARP
jgi:hypothetical protein